MRTAQPRPPINPNAAPIVPGDLARILQAPLPWTQFSGKTVVITGVSGMLPAYLARTLLFLNTSGMLEAPVRVVGLVRNVAKAQAIFSEYANNPDFELLHADLGESLPPEARTLQPDFLIHAASPASPKDYTADPLGTLRVNTLGTDQLLALAHQSGTESILAFSSSEVYGDLSHLDRPVRETDMGTLDPLSPRACYAEAKRTGEALCVAWHRQYNLPIKIARPFHTYGPGLRLDDGRVFADFTRNLINGEDIVLKSAGGAKRAFCYLSDATAAFFTLLLSGENGEAYNVGNPEALVSVAELAERLVALYPERGLRVRREFTEADTALASSIQLSCPDVGKLKALGWQPNIGIEEGFRRTVDSFSKETTAP